MVLFFLLAVPGCARAGESSGAAEPAADHQPRCAELAMQPPPRDQLPLMRMNPKYPAEARAKGIEGHVLVEFSVTPEGTTDSFLVLESEPPGVFDRAALAALYHWRYCTSHVEYPPGPRGRRSRRRQG